MDVVFDRYAPAGAGGHCDLATGRLVRIVTAAVLDDEWRRRWWRRVEALLEGCVAIQPLVDAGECGRHDVFEVVGVVKGGDDAASARPAWAARVDPVALDWLDARGLCAGPCRPGRVLDDGRLKCDMAVAWPIETRAERREAARQRHAWRAASATRAARARALRPVTRDASLDDRCEFDERAGLVFHGVDAAEALRYARRSGSVALSLRCAPSSVPAAMRARRAFVLVDDGTAGDRARWAAALAIEGGRRHYLSRAPVSPPVLRERAVAYVAEPAMPPAVAAAPLPVLRLARALIARAGRALAAGHVAAAARDASRAVLLARADAAVRAEAVALWARALRYDGRAVDAARGLDAELRGAPGGVACVLLVEAAEAATDCARLDQGEALARAALLAARSAAEQARARAALDRARVWRGHGAEAGLWRRRAASMRWGASPPWPERGAYPHAPAGRLARWEAACDRIERALWDARPAAARRALRRLITERARLPPLLAARADWLAAHAGGAAADATKAAQQARRLGASGILQTGKAQVHMEMLEHLSSLLTMCQEGGDDAALLAGAAARTRQLLRARAVAVYASGRALPIAGDGHGWNVSSALAAECAGAAHAAGPETTGAETAAAASIRCGNRPIGALVASWSAGAGGSAFPGTDDRRVRLLLEAAALAVSPVLRAWSASAEAPASGDMPEIVGASAAVAAVRDAVRRVARVPFPVLIDGESGAGKELVARAIHRLSPRAARAFRALNCAAMAEELVEAELFGHAQGAYTGAMSARAGLFEDADGGTLFLDEVSELSPRAQAKLLRALQEGEVRRVGETVARRADARIVAASNVPLPGAVQARAFRADLLFRLDVLRITVPPLRERPEDIPLLAAHFWREAAARVGTEAQLSPALVADLCRWPWPGNVRELQNVMASVAVAAPRRGQVEAGALPAHIRASRGPRPTLLEARAAFERDLVRGALARANNRPARAALELGVSRQGLAKLMRRLGIAG